MKIITNMFVYELNFALSKLWCHNFHKIDLALDVSLREIP